MSFFGDLGGQLTGEPAPPPSQAPAGPPENPYASDAKANAEFQGMIAAIRAGTFDGNAWMKPSLDELAHATNQFTLDTMHENWLGLSDDVDAMNLARSHIGDRQKKWATAKAWADWLDGQASLVAAAGPGALVAQSPGVDYGRLVGSGLLEHLTQPPAIKPGLFHLPPGALVPPAPPAPKPPKSYASPPTRASAPSSGGAGAAIALLALAGLGVLVLR